MPFTPKHYDIGFRPNSVAIQGQLASFSHDTVTRLWEEFQDAAIHCFDDFESPLKAVVNEEVDVAVIPYRNTIAGDVPYVHSLLGKKKLSIIGEFHLGVQFHLLTLPGAKMLDIKEVHSHSHALGQCRGYLARHSNWDDIVNPDTGGAAKMVAELGDPTKAAIASSLAAHRYGLHKADWSIQDDKDPITRFFVFARDAKVPEIDPNSPRPPRMEYVTNLYIKPKRNVARHVTDVMKLFEEILPDRHEPTLGKFDGDNFRQEGYSCEFMGHVDEKAVKTLMHRLGEICSEVSVIGCYKAHHFHRFPHRAGPKLAEGGYTYGLNVK